jgi:hypothetical protein
MPSNQNTALRDGLFYVMEKMEWYMAISQASSLDSLAVPDSVMRSARVVVRDRVTALLQALLEYEAKAVCFFHGKSSLTRTMSYIFSADWEAELKMVRDLEAEVTACMAQFNSAGTTATLGQISQDTAKLSQMLHEMRNLREQGDEERQRQATTRRLELVAKFSTETTCPYLERMMAVPKRVQGTCEWFQTHRKYRDWLQSPDGALLLSADPGCGKSVLSRFLIEEALPAEMDPDTTICYFFVKDSPDQNNVPAALCALIHQILTKRPEMTDHIRKDVIESGAALTTRERVLWRIFEKLVLEHVSDDLVCVLDAFDECQREGRLSLVERIQSILQRNLGLSSVNVTYIPQQTLLANRRPARTVRAAGLLKPGESRRGKVRLLITTRGYPEIIRLFDSISRGCIHLAGENKAEVDQIQREIEMVADYRLDQLAADRGFSEKRKAALRQSFREKGGQQRTYLWVTLVFDVLESNLRDQLRVWQGIINTLPQTVYDAYEKLLENVRDGERDRVMMLFRLMIAAFRPLPLQTAIRLLNAMEVVDEEGLLIGETDARREEEIEWESEKSFRAWVLGTCGIFVTVYDQQLFFIHQTAKEFLQQQQQKSGYYPLPSTKIPREPPGTSTLVTNTNTPTFRHSISATEAHKVMTEACIALWKYGDKPTSRWVHDERYRYPLELWAQHFREAQVFALDDDDDDRGSYPRPKLVSDIDAHFWDTYLALWQDTTFIRAQQLGQFLAKCDRATYEAPEFTDEVRLAFIASYGHYRLLQTELGRVGVKVPVAVMPFLLSAEGVAKECAGLLSRHLPIRPVVVVSEYN